MEDALRPARGYSIDTAESGRGHVSGGRQTPPRKTSVNKGNKPLTQTTQMNLKNIVPSKDTREKILICTTPRVQTSRRDQTRL